MLSSHLANQSISGTVGWVTIVSCCCGKASVVSQFSVVDQSVPKMVLFLCFLMYFDFD